MRLPNSCFIILGTSLSLLGCGSDDTSSEGTEAAGGSAGAGAAEGSGGDAPGGSAGTGPPTTEERTPPLPSATAPCPTLITTDALAIGGAQVQTWVGARREDVKAPILFYWHGLGSVSTEAAIFMQTQIDEVVAEGGVVASFKDPVLAKIEGDDTTGAIWSEADYRVADEILACAVEQLNIDTRRIYSAGCSAGGLQTSSMTYFRSEYLAAAMPNSGGVGAPWPVETVRVPPVMTAHGTAGVDVVLGLDFASSTDIFVQDVVARGGFAVNCNHNSTHCAAGPELIAAQWQFLKDHPYGTAESPYMTSGLPASFPAYCEIVQ